MSRPFSKLIAAILLAVSLSLGAVPVSAAALDDSASSYTDVAKDHYASKEIARLSQRGIIQGFSDGSFKPDEDITRGIAALWLSRALKLGYPASLDGFTDVPAASEYAVAVNALAEKNIIQGDDFLPMPL